MLFVALELSYALEWIVSERNDQGTVFLAFLAVFLRNVLRECGCVAWILFRECLCV
jgi:hypothetical protein